MVGLGFTREEAATVGAALARNPDAMLEFVAAYELELGSAPRESPAVHAGWMFAADLFAASIPVIPFAFLPLEQARVVSLVLTTILLIRLGVGRAGGAHGLPRDRAPDPGHRGRCRCRRRRDRPSRHGVMPAGRRGGSLRQTSGSAPACRSGPPGPGSTMGGATRQAGSALLSRGATAERLGCQRECRRAPRRERLDEARHPRGLASCNRAGPAGRRRRPTRPPARAALGGSR
jgi:hypothetical protein